MCSKRWLADVENESNLVFYCPLYEELGTTLFSNIKNGH